MSTASERLDQLIAETPDWRGPAVAHLRRLIHEADPDIVETWKWVSPNRPGTPCFEHAGIVCHINILKGRVRLTMTHGASLPDPAGLFNVHLDSGARRAIDWYETDPIQDDAVRAIVAAGVRTRVGGAA